MDTEIVCIVSGIWEAAGYRVKVRCEVKTNPSDTSAPNVQANPRNQRSLKETLNPFRVQRGTFVTLRSASECKQILVEHTKSPSLIGKLLHHRNVKRKEPIYEGFVINRAFRLRASRSWIKGTVPELRGTIEDSDDGTRVDVELRIPIGEVPLPTIFIPGVIGAGLVSRDTAFLFGGLIIAIAFSALLTLCLWSNRNAWDHYTWFLETFLSATLLTPGYTDNG